jgi:hypothetical protein
VRIRPAKAATGIGGAPAFLASSEPWFLPAVVRFLFVGHGGYDRLILRRALLLMVLTVWSCRMTVFASGHGPVFGLTTPTNAKGGWSLDLGLMGRAGRQDSGAMFRAMLGYGITEDLQISVSAPLVFSSAPLAPARVTGMMPANGDLEGVAAWRFHRRGTRVGTRVETTAYGGIILPGPQRPAGMLRDLRKAPGVYTAIATGMASRSHYLWGGLGNVRFAESDGDRRPSTFLYSFVWGYRPPSWRKEYPRWDWRVFAEMTGENSGGVRQAGAPHAATGGHQVFLGPAMLGIYRNYAIEGGVQFPVLRDVGSRHQQERLRFAINFSYFF